jgi:hypothetical protein
MSDYCQGILFSVSSGKQLDIYGEWYKVKRKRFLFIKEPDFFYKKRLWNKAIAYYEQGITFGDLIRG